MEKKHILALKKADVLVFRTVEGVSQIEAVKRESETNPFEQRIIIPVKSIGGINACHVETSMSYCYELQTIISLIKENDEVFLDWYRGAWSSEKLKQYDLVGDSLHIEIRRGKKIMRFLVHVQISGEQYRMIPN